MLVEPCDHLILRYLTISAAFDDMGNCGLTIRVHRIFKVLTVQVKKGEASKKRCALVTIVKSMSPSKVKAQSASHACNSTMEKRIVSRIER